MDRTKNHRPSLEAKYGWQKVAQMTKNVDFPMNVIYVHMRHKAIRSEFSERGLVSGKSEK